MGGGVGQSDSKGFRAGSLALLPTATSRSSCSVSSSMLALFRLPNMFMFPQLSWVLVQVASNQSHFGGPLFLRVGRVGFNLFNVAGFGHC